MSIVDALALECALAGESECFDLRQRAVPDIPVSVKQRNAGDSRLFKLTQYVDSATLHRLWPTRRLCPT